MDTKKSKVVQTIETAIQKITLLEQKNVKEYSEEYDMEFSYISNMLRKALELFSGEILQKYQIAYEENTTLFEKVQLIRKGQIFTEEQLSLFEKIRYIGNGAVHTNESGYPDTNVLKAMANSFLKIVKKENQSQVDIKEDPRKLAERAFRCYYMEDMKNPQNILTLKSYMNEILRVLSYEASQMKLENETVCSKKEIAEFQKEKKERINSIENAKASVENSKTSEEDLLKWATNEREIRWLLTYLYKRVLGDTPPEKCDPFAYKFLVHNDILVDETIEEYEFRKDREKKYRGIGRFESVEDYKKRIADAKAEKEKKEKELSRRKIGGIFRYIIYLAINLPLNYFAFKIVFTILDTLAHRYNF